MLMYNIYAETLRFDKIAMIFLEILYKYNFLLSLIK